LEGNPFRACGLFGLILYTFGVFDNPIIFIAVKARPLARMLHTGRAGMELCKISNFKDQISELQVAEL
jgi:hypothetical protein